MSQRSEEMDIGQLQQKAREHLEKALLEQGKAFAKSEEKNNELKKKLELKDAEMIGLLKKLKESEITKKKSDKDRDRWRDHFITASNEREKSEAQTKEIQKKLEECESQKKELDKIKEAQKEELEQHKIKLKRMEKVNLEQRKANETLLKQREKENEELRKKISELENLKKEKEEELADAEALNTTLTLKELESNSELQEARTELKRGWESTSCAFIGLKRMGELDSKPFQNACKRKYQTEEADDQAAALCSLWEDYMRDSNWHPFVTRTDPLGHPKEIIDENDTKLIKLKNEFGVEVHRAVSTALLEMNEYNSSGRFPVNELWNFKQNRRASLKEGILHVLKQLKLQKKRKSY